MNFRVAFPGGKKAAGYARRELEHRLAGVLAPERMGDLQLLVTEIIANSVRHGGVEEDGEIELRVIVRANAVRIEMRDTGIQADPRVRRPDFDGGGGFGMVLVERMSERWGVEHEPREDGRPRVVMWFELLREPVAGGAPEVALEADVERAPRRPRAGRGPRRTRGARRDRGPGLLVRAAWSF
jgi:serine/threonine-protein kinase RsbW